MARSVDDQILRHFGLRENPFGVTPDPRFLFMSRTHREALASLVNGIECGFGFQVLIAQPGMGKTTLLFDFLERFANSRTAFLFQQQHNSSEMLHSLLTELKSDSEETSQAKLYGRLNHMLSEAALTRERVIVVVDEAQNLDDALLETLRQLSNFETARAKLLQIVLAGQPQLAKKLAGPEQEQLRQRVSTIARLSPFGLDETRIYLNHRLGVAGYHGPELFTMAALQSIWTAGRGIPRNINTLGFNAMLLAFAQGAKRVDEGEIKEAVQDLDLDFVLADVAGLRPSSVGRGEALASRISAGEQKPNYKPPQVVSPSPNNGARPLIAEPTTEPLAKPIPVSLSELRRSSPPVVGNNGGSPSIGLKHRNPPTAVPESSLNQSSRPSPSIAKPSPSGAEPRTISASIGRATGARLLARANVINNPPRRP